MEIADLNLIADFEAGMKCLQNPSLISKIPKLYSFWTFGALILAIFATFTNLFNKIKHLFHQIRLKFLLSCHNSCQQPIFSDDFDFSDDEDFDFDINSLESNSESESEIEELESENEEMNRGNEVFRAESGSYLVKKDEGQKGNFTLRRRNGFSWSDFSAGKSVVQLWDSFGLGLDFEDDEFDYGEKIAIWDLDRDVKLSSGRRCEIPAPADVAENVVLTAEVDGGSGGVGFGTYDSRVDGGVPAIYAAWRPRAVVGNWKEE